MKRDLVIIPFGFFVAFLMLLPHLVLVRSLGDDFRGIYHFTDDDGPYYAARIREVKDGYLFLGNPYLAEHKNKPPMQFFIPDWIATVPLWFTGTSTAQGIIWSTFLWIPILVALCYFAFRTFTGSRFWAFMGVLALFSYSFLRYWSRPVSPQTTMLPWFLLLWLIGVWCTRIDEYAEKPLFPERIRQLAEKSKGFHIARSSTSSDTNLFSRRYLLLGGLAFGSLFYMYPYGWTFYTVLFAVLIVLGAFGFHAPLKKILLGILGIGFAIGIPYFLLLFRAMQLPEYGESLTRLGLIATHFPSGIRIVLPSIILLLIYAFCVWRGYMQRNVRTTVIAAGFIALVGVVNQHILTGKNLEFSSHYSDTAYIWIALGLAYLGSQLDKILQSNSRSPAVIPAKAGIHNSSSPPLTIRGGWVGLIVRGVALLLWAVLLLPYSIGVVRSTVSAAKAQAPQMQAYQPVFDALVKQTQPDDVVYANETLSRLIPIYTHNSVYYDRHANLFFISDEEVRERFLRNHYFDGVDESYLRSRERSLWGVRYIDQVGHARQKNKARKLISLESVPLPSLPQEEIKNTLERFTEIRKERFGDALKKYRVDWLVWDKQADPQWQGVEHIASLERVADIEGRFMLYRVMK